jgi:hypothetical protein
MTSRRHNFVASRSTLTDVCNVLISLEIQLISQQDEQGLWSLYASAMRHPTSRITPDGEKRRILQKLLSISRGSRDEAIKYLEHVKQALHPDAVQIGVRQF